MMTALCLCLAGIFFILASNNNVNSKIANYCRTSDGDPGRCIDRGLCPRARNNDTTTVHGSVCDPTGSFVCCPVMQRIVTPDVPQFQPQPQPPVFIPPTQGPVVLPTFATVPPPGYPPVGNPAGTPAPIISVTTKNQFPGNNMATAKCEEYKHRVKKRESIMTYVFGGTESLSKEFPHMAALGYGQPSGVEWLCGGSLISEQFVLTAAHCLTTANLGELVRVRLGDLNLQSTQDDADPQDFTPTQKLVHPDYHLPQQYNDLGLVRLDRPVQFNEYVAPICLETQMNPPNSNFVATGWGRTELGGTQSDTLMKVDLEYFPNEECNRNYELVSPTNLPNGIEEDTQICAGSHFAMKDTCQGDSGGPLQIRDNTGDTLYIVGITSFGKVCGEPNSPAVYTRVSYYVPWIEQNVWTS